MNQENYDFINKEILAVYDKLDKDYKKSYDDNVESYKQNIDIYRDEYLTMLMGQISNMSPDKARVKLNEVYHNSNGEKDIRKIWGRDIPSWIPFSKISYKDYWEKLKNEYSKEINKN